jgi:hypothetical protein|nr:MAG TPA: hypothetical protein [Bacteriophage sp.]
MIHTLVIPNELDQKLNAAYKNTATRSKWLAIGIKTVDDMKNRIKERLNKKNPKLEITNIRTEDKINIKKRIDNSSRVSMFAGYFENKNGMVDALFFYVDPDAGNANDFLASKIPAVILGIYKNHSNNKCDLHINNMPVYIVSICTSSRVNNPSVKQQIICAETIGMNYIDIFDNRVYDIINSGSEDVNTKIQSVQELDTLLSQGGSNDSFHVNIKDKILSIKCVNMLQRTNDTAYIYRWFLKCIPAVYLAANEDYTIDLSKIETLTNGDIPLIREYIRKFPKTR